ncbi:hypothetical protein DOY81_011760 [Sarcophaga bullata]|nr:hypothetical protein DOY81_011760 [Sarcophaga bullata]
MNDEIKFAKVIRDHSLCSMEKNPTIFAWNSTNVTLPRQPALPFNYTPQLRVVGAYRMEPHTLAKYVVSIRQTGEPQNLFGYTHFCAGSIIEANRILTAAHCAFENKFLKPYQLKVVAKTYIRLKKTADTEEIIVKKIIYHKKFSTTNLVNDIALLILARDIHLDGKLATKIPLPQQRIPPGTLCTVIGWGQMYTHGPMANNLLYGDLNLVSKSYCRKWIPQINAKKICALNHHEVEVDACIGDSGGPLICPDGLDVITGIVSYGYGCADGYPGVYTDVYEYVRWINTALLQELNIATANKK